MGNIFDTLPGDPAFAAPPSTVGNVFDTIPAAPNYVFNPAAGIDLSQLPIAAPFDRDAPPSLAPIVLPKPSPSAKFTKAQLESAKADLEGQRLSDLGLLALAGPAADLDQQVADLPATILNQPARLTSVLSHVVGGPAVPDTFQPGKPLINLPTPQGLRNTKSVGRGRSVDIPPVPLNTNWYDGVAAELANTASGLTTPENLFALPAAGASPVVRALFGAQMAGDLPAQAQNIRQVLANPNSTDADIGAAITSPVVAATFLGLMVHHENPKPQPAKPGPNKADQTETAAMPLKAAPTDQPLVPPPGPRSQNIFDTLSAGEAPAGTDKDTSKPPAAATGPAGKTPTLPTPAQRVANGAVNPSRKSATARAEAPPTIAERATTNPTAPVTMGDLAALQREMTANQILRPSEPIPPTKPTAVNSSPDAAPASAAPASSLAPPERSAPAETTPAGKTPAGNEEIQARENQEPATRSGTTSETLGDPPSTSRSGPIEPGPGAKSPSNPEPGPGESSVAPTPAAVPETAPPLRATIGQRADELAGNLESLKSGASDRASLNAFGVVPYAWDGAISLAQGVIRAGGTMADAINSAITHIRANHPGGFDETEAQNELASAFKPKPNAAEKSQIKTALAAALKGIRRKVTNRSTGFDISITRAGLEKAASGKAVRKTSSLEAHLEALRQLPRLLRQADLRKSRPSRKKNDTVSRIHQFVAPLDFKGKTHSVKSVSEKPCA